MIDVSLLMSDPDFCDSFTIYRRKGTWAEGNFVLGEPTIIKRMRPVQPATARDLEQIPEADRTVGMLKFFAKSPETFYLTRNSSNDEGYSSDKILYRGNWYKIVQVMPWDANGFQRAFGQLLETEEG